MSQILNHLLKQQMAPMSHRTRLQKTLKKEVSIKGVGLFTGTEVQMSFLPAKENTGIVFERVDLPGCPRFPAKVDFVQATPRCTILGKDHAQVQTVEHVLSALSAYEIDNLIIQIDAEELPIADGSSLPFVQMIEKAEITEQEETVNVYSLNTPVFWSKDQVHLVAMPSDQFQISYTLTYPHSPLIGTQFYSAKITPELYKKEIAFCRTFSLYEEVTYLIEKGLLKGGSLDRGLIIQGDKVLNPEGLRAPDEMVKHKVLDLLGDLSLIGCSITMHVIAIRSGHFSNTSLAKELVKYITMEIVNG